MFQIKINSTYQYDRWVGENFIVNEDPVGVVAVPDTTGDTLFNVIKDLLMILNLPIIGTVVAKRTMAPVACKEISRE